MNAVEKFDLDGSDLTESLDFRSLVASASPSEIEAACKYEYMRESQTLRDTISNPKKSGQKLPSSFDAHLTFAQSGLLFLALQRGFPKPWNRLTEDSKQPLISLIAEWKTEMREGNKALGIPPENPLLIIEPVQSDSLAIDHKLPYFWPENAPEPTLFQTWGDRKYFKGFIRLDEECTESEAVEAFGKWFRGRHGPTQGGGGPKWGNRLKQLVVMRIWKRETSKWKRLQLVAEFCEYKGCVKEAAAYKERCNVGRGDEPMSNAAKVEMSSARAEALKHFQDLFPGEKPLNWNDLDEEKS